MIRSRAIRLLPLLATVVLAAAGCGSSAPSTPPPSPTGVIQQMVSVFDFVLYDGRRIHVARMQGEEPTSSCEEQSDRAVASRLVGGEQTITLSQARVKDVDSVVPAAYVQADVRTPSLTDYADTFAAQAPRAREEACPVEIPEPVEPSETSEPSSTSSGDVDVDVDRDHHETRFCRRHIWC